MEKLLPLFHERRECKLGLFMKWKGFYSWFSLDRMEVYDREAKKERRQEGLRGEERCVRANG